MRNRIMILTIVASIVVPAYTYAAENSPSLKIQPQEVISKLLPGSQILGSGQMKYLGWLVYDATLYSKDRNISPDKPFALKLNYHLSASKDQIAQRSLEGMREVGFTDEVKLAAWYRQMLKIFPNVRKGTQLTGLYLPSKGAQFYLGSKHIGTIKDPQFGKWFFNIWLSERTNLKNLRRQLLGIS